jgi:hypothetical protein
MSLKVCDEHSITDDDELLLIKLIGYLISPLCGAAPEYDKHTLSVPERGVRWPYATYRRK